MRIVTAADYHMKDLLDNLCASAEKHGYPIDVFNLGGLTRGLRLPAPERDRSVGSNGFIPCLFKIEAIERSLRMYNDHVAWVDADCEIRSRFDEVVAPDQYDVGFVQRIPNERAAVAANALAGTINTGVLFCMATAGTRKFLSLWREYAERLDSEQGAINYIAGNTLSERERHLFAEVTFRRFDGELYNNYYLDGRFGGDPKKGKILHYKMEVRRFRHDIEN